MESHEYVGTKMWFSPNVCHAKNSFQQITFTHHFVNITQNILYLSVRLIWTETRHLGFQFKHKNEAIPIKIENNMIF